MVDYLLQRHVRNRIRVSLKIINRTMKKLTKKEYEKMEYKGMRNQQNSAIYDAIYEMKIGEILLINRKDWKAKITPVYGVRSLCTHGKRKKYENTRRGRQFIGKKYQFRTLKDDSGWVLTRIK